MNILHLEYFIHLVKVRSITKASEDYFTTRQNFSKIIKGIEQELGVTLFLRGRLGVVLTEDGKIFLNFAEKVLKEQRIMIHAMSQNKINRNVRGTLQLYGGVIVLAHMLSEWLPSFNEKYPNIDIMVHEGDPISALQEIVQASDRVGLLQIMTNKRFEKLYAPWILDLDVTPLIPQDAFLCLVSVNHPLARLKVIRVKDFIEEPYADLFQNEMLLKALSFFEEPKVKFSTKNISLYFDAIATAKYVGIISQVALNHQKGYGPFSELKAIPFEEDFSFQTCLVHKKKDPPSKAFSYLLEFLLSHYEVIRPEDL